MKRLDRQLFFVYQLSIIRQKKIRDLLIIINNFVFVFALYLSFTLIKQTSLLNYSKKKKKIQTIIISCQLRQVTFLIMYRMKLVSLLLKRMKQEKKDQLFKNGQTSIYFFVFIFSSIHLYFFQRPAIIIIIIINNNIIYNLAI